MEGYRFLDGQGIFALEQPENYSYQYFPIVGKKRMKSALTSTFGGDSWRRHLPERRRPTGCAWTDSRLCFHRRM
ncbi:hypothetical protein D7V90_10230 [bacterium 1xD42-87]|nr:hypothetical protein D7V90_10230 [bacterium 1xD42-87]